MNAYQQPFQSQKQSSFKNRQPGEQSTASLDPSTQTNVPTNIQLDTQTQQSQLFKLQGVSDTPKNFDEDMGFLNNGKDSARGDGPVDPQLDSFRSTMRSTKNRIVSLKAQKVAIRPNSSRVTSNEPAANGDETEKNTAAGTEYSSFRHEMRNKQKQFSSGVFASAAMRKMSEADVNDAQQELEAAAAANVEVERDVHTNHSSFRRHPRSTRNQKAPTNIFKEIIKAENREIPEIVNNERLQFNEESKHPEPIRNAQNTKKDKHRNPDSTLNNVDQIRIPGSMLEPDQPLIASSTGTLNQVAPNNGTLTDNLLGANTPQNASIPVMNEVRLTVAPAAVATPRTAPAPTPAAVSIPVLGGGTQTEDSAALALDNQLYLMRIVGFDIFLCITSVMLLLLSMNIVAYYAVYIVICSYCLYFMGESVYRIKKYKRGGWIDREEIFRAVNVFGAIIFIIIICLKFSGIMQFPLIACIPHAITTLLYCFLSTAPYPSKPIGILLHIIVTLQVFLITAKIQGIITWDWLLIFSFFWVYFSTCSIYFFAFTTTILGFFLCLVCKFVSSTAMDKKTEFIGSFWHFLYYGIGLIVFGDLLGVAIAYNPSNNFSTLFICSILGIVAPVYHIFHTTFFNKTLMKYLMIYNAPQAPETIILDAGDQGSNNKAAKVKLEVEKKSNHFVMVSKTYFMPLHKAMQLKNALNLERITKMLSSISLKGKKAATPVKKEDEKEKKPVEVKELKEFKLKLDKIFDNNGNMTPRVDTPKKQLALKIPAEPAKEIVRAKSKVLSPMKKRILSDTKLRSQFSADDIDKMITPLNGEQPQSRSLIDENLCYICYENAPDAVLMPCGHGGVCYDCALELVQKKTANCMECRGEIDTVYKVDPNPKFFDIIQSQEASKVKKPAEAH